MIALPLLLAAAAAAPSDYAYAWPLATAGEAGAWQVELSPEIHAALVDPSLRDLEVFDAEGHPLPASRYEPPPPAPVERRVALPVFGLPRPAGGEAWDVRFRVERGPDRALREVTRATVEAGPGRVTDYLLDASRVEGPIAALVLTWTARPGATTARFAVEGSEDLERWSVLVPAATVVALHAEGDALERREIAVPPTRATYLRLRALEAADLGPLEVEAKLAPAPLAPVRRWQETALASETSVELPDGRRQGEYTYELPGWLDVEAVRLEPAGRRTLAAVTLRSLVGEEDLAAWLPRGGFTLVGVRQGEEAVVRDEAPVSPGPRSRRWKVEAIPPFEAPPRLFVSARPDRLAFLAQGPGPYRLAAGSGTARRADAPVDAALAELRRRFGPTWEPEVAALGEREVLGGERARAPAEAPWPWKTWVLWAVLAGGAGLVALFAARLLRSAPAAPRGGA